MRLVTGASRCGEGNCNQADSGAVDVRNMISSRTVTIKAAEFERWHKFDNSRLFLTQFYTI